MPTQYTTACPLQGSNTAVATLGAGQTFPVNFSGVTDSSGNPSTFTVGGWVRRQSLSASGTVFAVNGQLTLTMDSNGVLTAILGNTQVVSEVPITDALWHYISVSYLPSVETNETGILTIYIDGLEATGESVNVTNSVQPVPGCFLGVNGAPFEFVSWAIWSQELPSDALEAPEWANPAIGTEAANGLVAAFDFAAGAPTDTSGNHYLVSVAAQNTHTPCLSLSAGGTATLGSSSVAPGEGSGTPAAFTIMGWAYVPNPTSPSSYMLFMNGDRALMLLLSCNATNNLAVGYGWAGASYQGTTVLGNAWHHYALTWDGNNTVSFYVDGLLNNTASAAPTGFTIHDPTIGNAESGNWYMQGLSIWSTCLNAASISSYMNGADPTDQTGCVASFPLLTDLGDSTNGSADVLTPTNCAITDFVTSGISSAAATATSSAAVTATNVQTSTAAEGPRLLLPADLKAIARKNGIDVDTPLSDAEMAGPDYADIGKWFDGATSNLPAKAAARLKNEFLRNARTGMQLRQKGIQAGTFSTAVEGGDTVTYYHTEAGPQEVNRLTGVVLTPMQTWAMTITTDVLTLVAAIFGLATTAAKVSGAAARLQPQIDNLVARIQAAFKVTDAALLKAKEVSWAVLDVTFQGNLVTAVATAIITGSWWSMAFTIVNTALMIGLIVASQGAALIIRFVASGVALGQLVYHLTQQPPSEAEPAEAAAAAAVNTVG